MNLVYLVGKYSGDTEKNIIEAGQLAAELKIPVFEYPNIPPLQYGVTDEEIFCRKVKNGITN